jgi:predicted TIM-barrel fold metal-dependent hydrolase
MKLGRFVVDTHVHAQRFAVGAELAKAHADPGQIRYDELATAIRRATPYDNSARLLYDMACYDVDMCVLLPAFGMTNELNLQIVDANPDRFVAVCGAMETARRAIRDEEPWSAAAAAAELDALLTTGRFVGLGEGMPSDPTRKTTLGQTERMDQIRPVMEVARKHKTVARVHTGMVMGYPMTHHYWPESLHPIWITDLAAEYKDVVIVLDHGGLQGWWSERLVEEALCVAAAHDNVYLETGLWWTDLYAKALRDPNVGPEKLLWGCDWGASIPFHTQLGATPPVYAVQLRKQPIVRHQVDVWGWSLKQLLRLDISQDDLNLMLGGNAARIYRLKVPQTRLFRPVDSPAAGSRGDANSLPPKCG